MAAKHTIQKIWIWCKNHTGLLLAATWALILYIALRREDTNSAREVLAIRREAHQKEMAATKEAHEKETKIKEENLEKFHETVARIEEKYEEENRVLSRDKKKRVKKLVEDFHDRPEQLTQIVSVMFGIPNEDNKNN